MFDGTPVEVPGNFNPVEEENGDLVLYRDGVLSVRMPKDGYYFDRVEKSPGAAHLDPKDFHPTLFTKEELEHFRTESKFLSENTDYALVACVNPPQEFLTGMGSGDFAAWWMTLAAEPEYVHQLFEVNVRGWLERLEQFADAVQDRVHILQVTDDFGTQESLLVSVKMFRELLMPYYKRGFDWVHKNTKMKVLLHTDGAVYPLIPSFIEMGVDCLNPVQINAKGMDPVKLKQEFGDQLVFWGGCCDCQQTLPFAKAEDVAREVEHNVGILGRGGGMVCAAIHNIQAGVPPENIVTLFDTARSIRYPLAA